MSTDTESLRQKFERHIVATGQFEGELIFEAGHYLCPDVQEIWERYQAVHAAAKAETAAAVAQERERCIGIIESHRIPVGNSAAGEMACEWTYDALKTIRDAIRAGAKEPDGDPTL